MPDPATLYWQIKDGVVQVIQNMNLQSADPDFAIGAKVYSQMFPDESAIETYPCVIVTTEGEREERLPGTTLHKDQLLPVRVFIADRESHRRHTQEKQYLEWRYKIADKFHRERPLDIYEVCWCDVEPQVIFDPKLPQYQFVVCGVVLKFFIRVRI